MASKDFKALRKAINLVAILAILSPGLLLLPAQASVVESGSQVIPKCALNETVNCPGSDATCKGNQCCPRGPGAATTLPCPSAHPDFTDCEGGTKMMDCLDPDVADELSETKAPTRTTTTTTKTSTKTTTPRTTTTKTTTHRSTRGSAHYDVTTTGFFFQYDYDNSSSRVVAPTMMMAALALLTSWSLPL
eukprot:CAMPEP_0206468988 /NCGR_PEP_ID=MMETSP0324_2-20121206/29984_1 /ASSEMBLY_ACC=CAM_ASM_000836 /TAXON_ID=2866 /ORGANISM="Crypthecodinium cohnii, Strain Seligo" /LENGTH=189 /DNA_ID=CAMNT_0053942605 /DNA_START=135 /DNA_END=704 /DNA_ORIENTATION=-